MVTSQMSQRHTDVTGAASDANVAAVSGAAAFEADVFAGGTMKGVGAHAGWAMSGVTGATIVLGLGKLLFIWCEDPVVSRI
jgi:hypothetical protein